jgi:hypothetical protein
MSLFRTLTSSLALGFTLFSPLTIIAQTIPSTVSPTTYSPPNYSYPPINNNGGIIQGISGGGQCGTNLSAEIGYGNSGGNNNIYSGGSGGFDNPSNANKSDINGKIVLAHSFNPCFSQRKQIELQMKESCSSRKDQFIAQLVTAQPNISVQRIDELLARFCGGKNM